LIEYLEEKFLTQYIPGRYHNELSMVILCLSVSVVCVNDSGLLGFDGVSDNWLHMF